MGLKEERQIYEEKDGKRKTDISAWKYLTAVYMYQQKLLFQAVCSSNGFICLFSVYNRKSSYKKIPAHFDEEKKMATVLVRQV